MNKLLQKMIDEIAKASHPITIGFPDGDDPRIIDAIKRLQNHKNIRPVLINNKLMASYDRKIIIDAFISARQGKKETISDFEKWSTIPNYFAMALLRMNKLDCVIGGATTSTADLIRPALQVVGAKVPSLTSYFWMHNDELNYFMGDCAIIPEPTESELVAIGSQISNSVLSLFNINPFIAMLSFSTNGSGGDKNQSVNNVRNASKELQAQNYQVLGETQFDAAFDDKTRAYKWKNSNFKQPNVYIFPDLNAGNIGYKIMKLTGNYEAVGPIVIGLNKPVNDLSRGADVHEIYTLALVTINMALKERQ